MPIERKSIKRFLLPTITVLALAWLAASGSLYEVMRRPPEKFAGFMAKVPGPVAFLVLPFETLWTRARAGSLEIGDAAPDFKLTKLDKTADVQLSSLIAQHQPVVLVFGSYT